MQFTNSNYHLTTDRSTIDYQVVHGFLSNCYWAECIPLSTLKRAFDHSLCFSLFDDSEQVGFARVITDYATFAYLADVFIVESHRGRGLSQWMMECILAHPEVQDLKRWLLVTRDAHGLYAKNNFKPLSTPAMYMEINRMGIWKQMKENSERNQATAPGAELHV